MRFGRRRALRNGEREDRCCGAGYHGAVLRRSVSRFRAHWRIAAGALLLAALSASLIGEARQRPPSLTADESQWITSGYVAWKLLRQLEAPARWEAAFDERELADWGNKNPPLGKYVIGVAVTPHVRSDADVNYHWAFFRPPDSPGPPNKAPPVDLLIAARTAIAVCGALTLVASYLVAFELIGTSLWACLAPLCLFLVPGFQFHATHVFTDAPQLVFLLLGTHALLVRERTGRAWWLVWALVCGGLACAVKPSAGVFCVGALLTVGQRSLRRNQPRWPLLAAVVVPLAVFVAVNPYLYDDPFGKTVRLVRDWQTSKALQQQQPVVADQAVETLGRSFELMSLRGALAPTSTPFPRSLASEALWQRTPVLIGLASLALASLWLVGLRLSLRVPAGRLGLLLGAFLLGIVLEAALTSEVTWYGGLSLLGLWSLAADSVGPRAPALRAFSILLVSNWVITTLWLPFDWSRYYLPTLGLMSCVYAYGAATAARSFAWRTCEVGHALRSWPGIAHSFFAFMFAVAAGWLLISVITPPLLPP